MVLFLGLARRRDSSGHMDRNMVDADVFRPLAIHFCGCVRAQEGEFERGCMFVWVLGRDSLSFSDIQGHWSSEHIRPEAWFRILPTQKQFQIMFEKIIKKKTREKKRRVAAHWIAMKKFLVISLNNKITVRENSKYFY